MIHAIPVRVRFLAVAAAALMAGCAATAQPPGVPGGAAASARATLVPAGAGNLGGAPGTDCPIGSPEKATGKLTVTLRDEAGLPLPGRPVDVARQAGQAEDRCKVFQPKALWGNGRTDDSGQVAFRGLAPGTFLVTDRTSLQTGTTSVANDLDAALELRVPAAIPAGGSVPFLHLDLFGYRRMTLGGEGRALWLDDQAAFDAALAADGGLVLRSPPIDFATAHVLVVQVMGNACQGTQVAALIPDAGTGLTVKLEAYDQKCQNIQGPSPTLAYFKVARRDLPGSPTPNLPGTWTPATKEVP